jgi:hypothetical protein
MNNLIEKSISGQSAKYLIDSLVDDLPPITVLNASIRRELPKKTEFEIEENTVYITAPVASTNVYVNETTETLDRINKGVEYLRLVYPELEFVIKK